MRYFKIKHYVFGKGDPFGFKATSDHVMLAAFGLPELYKTVRFITPQGYRVPKGPTLGKRLSIGYPITGKNLLGTKTIEIIEVAEKPVVSQILQATNSRNITYGVKITA